MLPAPPPVNRRTSVGLPAVAFTSGMALGAGRKMLVFPVTPFVILNSTYSLSKRLATTTQWCQTLTARPWKFGSGKAVATPAVVGPTTKSASQVVGGNVTPTGQRASRLT